MLGLQRRDRHAAAVDPGNPLQHRARLFRHAAAVQVHRRLRDRQAQHHADQGRNAGHEKDHAPGIVLPAQRRQRQHRQQDGADRPEGFEQHQPASAPVAGQEFGHHRVIDRQRAADADAGQKAQGQQPAEVGREAGGDAEAGVDQHRGHQHRAAPDAVRQAAEHEGADQHADEEEGAGLQRARHGDVEGFRDARGGEADRQDLHGVGHPDQAEDDEQAVLEFADACGLDALLHCCRYGVHLLSFTLLFVRGSQSRACQKTFSRTVQ